MSNLKWYQKDGLWRTRCGRFAIEIGKRVQLFDHFSSEQCAYSSDSIKEAKQLAKRITRKQSTQR